MSAEPQLAGGPGNVPMTAPRGRGDRRFFTGMSVAALLIVFAGFARTYYLRGHFELRGHFGPPALSPLLHVHGALFTSWILLFLTQTTLIATGRTDLHRRIGVAGALLALVMPIVGMVVAIEAARRGVTPAGGPPPLVFLVVPIFDLLLFTTLAWTGLYFRRTKDTHKRLMLLATISLLTPAFARLPGIEAGGPPAFFGLTDLLVVACLVYDRITRGRVHPAFLWGGVFVIASQPVRLLIGGTGAWLAFATWLTR